MFKTMDMQARKRYIFIQFLLVLLFFSTSSVCLAADLRVEIQESRLSLEAAGYPLQEVLQLISEKADFTLKTKGTLSEPVHLKLTDIPLEGALRRLAAKHSLIVLYVNKGDRDKIKDVWIFPKGGDETTEVEHMQNVTYKMESDALVRLELLVQNETDHVAMEYAVSELAGIGNAKALHIITMPLGSPDPLIRSLVAEKLGQVENEQAVLTLGQILMGDSDPEVRLAAVRSLSGKPEGASLDFLQAAANNDMDERVRNEAEKAL